MKFIKKIILSLTLLTGISFASLSANACSVKVGDFDWDSANIHTAIGSYIMQNGYGCDVSDRGLGRRFGGARRLRKLDAVLLGFGPQTNYYMHAIYKMCVLWFQTGSQGRAQARGWDGFRRPPGGAAGLIDDGLPLM